jgi:hypothetical protein
MNCQRLDTPPWVSNCWVLSDFLHLLILPCSHKSPPSYSSLSWFNPVYILRTYLSNNFLSVINRFFGCLTMLLQLHKCYSKIKWWMGRDWEGTGMANFKYYRNILAKGSLSAIAQAVSGWLPTAAARVRSRVWSSGICGGQSGTEAGFLRVLRFPLPILIEPIAPQLPSPIWGWYNRREVAAVQGT